MGLTGSNQQALKKEDYPPPMWVGLIQSVEDLKKETDLCKEEGILSGDSF